MGKDVGFTWFPGCWRPIAFEKTDRLPRYTHTEPSGVSLLKGKYDFPIQVRPQWPCPNKCLTLKFPVQGNNDGGVKKVPSAPAP